jgi:hypothetical protein
MNGILPKFRGLDRCALKSVKFFSLKDINHQMRIFLKSVPKMTLILKAHRGGEEQAEQVAARAAAERAGIQAKGGHQREQRAHRRQQ